jgi:hypothetical protein
MGRASKIGDTENNRVQIKATLDNNETAVTGVHEFGHTAGLRHQNDSKNPIAKSVTRNNYMWYPYQSESPKKIINSKQIKHMSSYIKEKKE